MIPFPINAEEVSLLSRLMDYIPKLNWTNFPPKSTHQQQLLRDCYQNNATAEKEALNDVIREQICC